MRISVLILLASCASTPPGNYTPLDEGRTWQYQIQMKGYHPYLLTSRVFGSDVRSLPDHDEQVDFVFVYGRVGAEEGESAKSIYAAAPDGVREFYFDGGSWSMEHDPPIPLAHDAIWEGTLSINQERQEASARVEAKTTGNQLEVTTTYDNSPLVITRWFEKEVGLVRMTVRGAKIDLDVRLQ